MRDIDADYKAAYIAEHTAYKQSGRDEDAAHVADILRDRYEYDVDAEDADEAPAAPVEVSEGAPRETAVAAAPPEAAVEPQPAKKAAPARKPAAKKTTAAPQE